MSFYIIAALVLIVFGIILKRKKSFKIKDYSSDKLQNRTVFKDTGGFSFNDKSVSAEQINHDCRILNNVLKNAVSMHYEKKKMLKKLISNIKHRKISFQNLNYDNAINIINLSLDDISDLVFEDKSSILRKVFPFQKELYALNEQKIDDAKRHGLDENDLKQWISKLSSRDMVRNGFFTKEQYILLKEYVNDVNQLALKIPEMLNENQLQEISKHYVDYKDLAQYFIFYGRNSLYRFSKLKNVLPEKFFDDRNREPLIKILKGIDTLDENDFSVIKDANLKPVVSGFVPSKETHKNFIKSVKNISYINAFNNHDKILDALKSVEKRYIKIPNILVNFDSQPDIYINKQVRDANLANWINLAVKNYSVNNIYWVIPDAGLFDPFYFEYYFGENTGNGLDFRGNLNINKVYKNTSKPLFQRVLFDVTSASIDSNSAKFSDEEFNSYLKTGKYKRINIYTCTLKNLPKIKKNFILSIDGDYFNNCGFDSIPIIEQMPFDMQKVFDEFLSLYAKKLSKASIVALSVSPEMIGFDNIGSVRGFYEYFLKTVQQNSKKVY